VAVPLLIDHLTVYKNSIMGIANASVFPEPVCADPSISKPDN